MQVARWLLAVALLWGGTAFAEPPSTLPPLLAPWVPWVLEGSGEARCPEIQGTRVCVWPGALAIELSGERATFALRVTTDKKAMVALPGGGAAWPISVAVDKKPTPVLEPSGRPEVELERGSHLVTGSFAFTEPPANLEVPRNIGALSLRVNGRVIAQPKREESGLLWLAESDSGSSHEPQLSLSVHRRIEDAAPMRIITRVELTATGRPGELNFPGVLLAGTRPIELRANLPAQLAPDGSLRLQSQAGSFRIEVVAILDVDAPALHAPKLPEPWPAQEVWLFKADDQLRHVELTGPPQVDSARTDLAADWQGLPTFLVDSTNPLKLETRRRGEPEPPPNRLKLQRTLWLDLDGQGYTVRDQLHGTMRQGFRLELSAGKLGRASVAGRDALITQHGGRNGFELRSSNVDVVTEWRIEQAGADLPAVGYSEHVEELAATLNLPPGFMLLGARGVDSLRGSWFDSWDLFDFFFVLCLSLAVAKLAGPGFGVIALFALVLTQHETSAPGLTWLFLLVMTALTRALPRGGWGRFVRVLWGFSFALLLLALVPFVVQELRNALHPQLADDATSGAFEAPSARFEALEMKAAPSDEGSKTDAPLPEPAEALDVADALGVGVLGGVGSIGAGGGGRAEEALQRRRAVPSKQRGSDLSSYALRDIVDPAAIVQTGPGVPTWNFAHHALSWTGPVAADERLQLWLVPPPWTRAWSLLSVLLVGALLFALARNARLRGEPDPPDQAASPPAPNDPAAPSAATPAGAAPLLLLLMALFPNRTHAQTAPSPELLAELRARLLPNSVCAPSCASIPKLTLSLDEAELSVRAEVHAGDRAVIRAPGPLETWPIGEVRIDGRDALGAVRLDDGFLYVRVPAGIHVLELRGPAPMPGAGALALSEPFPHRVAAQARGWSVEGLHADGSAEASLELRRELSNEAGSAASLQALTPWLELRRELELGLRFRLKTTLTRLGPPGEAVLVRLPLLPGESVHEPGMREEQGSLVVTIPADQSSLSFASTLAAADHVALQAAQPLVEGALKHPYSESWVIRPSTLYKVRYDGIAPVTRLDAQGELALRFQPFPGERLALHVERLQAAQGSSVTLDRAEVRLAPGARMEQSTLSLSLRTSRGTTERITLPAAAQLSSLSVDQRAHPARIKQGVLELPLDPGTHAIEVTINRPSELSFRYSPALPKLPRDANNVLINITLPHDRWLLWTAGPAWGPAVVFWGYVAAFALFALALARVPRSPLRAHQWLLLGLGLTQVEAVVALIVVGWLFAMAYRDREVIAGRRLFNLVQGLLVLCTFVALWCLAYAVHQGLLVPPDMQVQGMMSNQNFVQWYADRTHGQLPEVTVWSAPIWLYKGLMLLWALWLAASLIHWLRFGWLALRKGGAYRSNPNRRQRTRKAGMRGTNGSDPPPDTPAGSADSERARIS